MQRKWISFMAMLMLGPSSLLAQATQTYTGTISDVMCGAHHMMKNATPAECTRTCVKQGTDFALVVGDKVYTLKGDKAQFDKWAGQKVTLKGTLFSSTITVESIRGS